MIPLMDLQNGNTALHFAAQRDHEECVKLLVIAGAKRNIKNEDGKIAEAMTDSNVIKRILIWGGFDGHYVTNE